MRHPDIEGYSLCRADGCEYVAPTEQLARTGHLCPEHVGRLQARLRQIEIGNRTAKETLVVNYNRTTHRGRTKGNPATKRASEAARMVALRRLAMLYPAVYQVLYGEERQARGLDPFPLEGKLLSAERLDEDLALMTLGATSVYPGAAGLANEVPWDCSPAAASPPSTRTTAES